MFGIGWGVLGYCPGTAAGALAEGRLDARWGLLGMTVGGMVYAALYPALKTTVIAFGDLGKVTLPGIQSKALGGWRIRPARSAVASPPGTD